MAEKDFTPAPGIEGRRFPWGVTLRGSRERFIGCGLAEESWFPVLPKLVRRTEEGGIDVKVKKAAGDWWISIYNPNPTAADEPAGTYDGNQTVAWSACAWQPNTARLSHGQKISIALTKKWTEPGYKERHRAMAAAKREQRRQRRYQ